MFGIESEDSRMKGLLEAADRRQSAIPQVTLNVESAFLSDVRDGMILIMVHEHQHTRFAQLKQPYARVEVKVLTVCVSSILAESHKHPAYLADACKFIVVLVATDMGTHLLLEHLSYSTIGLCVILADDCILTILVRICAKLRKKRPAEGGHSTHDDSEDTGDLDCNAGWAGRKWNGGV